jgi:hypothetical protein
MLSKPASVVEGFGVRQAVEGFGDVARDLSRSSASSAWQPLMLFKTCKCGLEFRSQVRGLVNGEVHELSLAALDGLQHLEVQPGKQLSDMRSHT